MGDELPFLTVQLAPFGYGSPEDYPQMVERQIAASRQTPGVAMITTSDLGECDNIHPLKKQPMAQRLFLAAEKLVYHKSVEYSGPSIVRCTVTAARWNSVLIMRTVDWSVGKRCPSCI